MTSNNEKVAGSFKFKVTFDILCQDKAACSNMENLLVEAVINYIGDDIGDQRFTIKEGLFSSV